MSVYFIAQITVKDTEEYQKYLDQSGAIFKRYKGTYLVVDDAPEILEGSWDFTRTVVIKFESGEDLKAWYYSKEYQEILKYRLNASSSNTILAEGLDQANS
jgi:uncharacterized protein (DUF1330 family)